MAAYSAGYENYDPYMSRSMSRRQSIGYPGTPYHHQGYSDGVAGSEYQQQYQTYPNNALVPMNRRLTGQDATGYDTEDPYYDERQMSMSYPSSMSQSNSMVMPRTRRHSTVSFATRPQGLDAYRVPSALHLKFKRKGSFSSGIGLDEAQQRIRLSGNDAYTFHDLHADSRGRIHLRVKWTGYSSLTYEIPLDGYDGRVDLQTLARRVSRACVHYLQANVIPILWDRVLLHHLEEVSYGVWQPMLSTR